MIRECPECEKEVEIEDGENLCYDCWYEDGKYVVGM